MNAPLLRYYKTLSEHVPKLPPFVFFPQVQALKSGTKRLSRKLLSWARMDDSGSRCISLTALVIFTVIGCLVVMVFCSLIFSHVEDWSFLDSFYTVFITIMTVGFGDFYPGEGPEV